MKRAMAAVLCMAMFLSSSLGVSAAGVSDTAEVQPVSVTEEITGDETQENVLDQNETSDEVQEENEISEVPDETQTDTEAADGAGETTAEMPEKSEDIEASEEVDEEIIEAPAESEAPEEDVDQDLAKPSEETADPEGEPTEDQGTEVKTDAEPADVPEETNTDQADTSEAPVSEEVTIEESVEMDTVAAYDTLGTAKSISMGSRQNGTITVTNTQDYYTFTLDRSSCVTIKGSYHMEYVNLYLYDAAGGQLWDWTPHWNNTTHMTAQESVFYLASGTYYYCVARNWKYDGDYDFTVTSVPSGETFKEVQGGSNNGIDTANRIDRNRNYKGQLSMNDSKDFYVFTLDQSGCVNLKGAYNIEWVYLKLYDADGKTVWEAHPHWNGTTKQSVQDTNLHLTSGTYYYCVERDWKNYGTYDFTWTFTPAAESFAEPQGGSNNNINSSSQIKVATTYKGQIALNDSADFYRVVMPQNGKYMLSLTGYMERINIYLYDKDGKEIYHQYPYWTSTKSQISFSDALTLSAGTYYLAFTRYSGNGNYQFQFGNPVQVGWQKQGGYWYYNDDNGVRQTGWQEIDGNWYYMSAVGVMQTGWTKVGNTWYYLGGNGARRTGWQKVSGKWYYMNSKGEMQTGWTQVGRNWYCLNSKGEMQTGWKRINGKWYCMDSKGVMQTGWTKVGGKWYYMNGSGVMQTGWTKVGRSWYCLNSSGVMQTGWKQINGKWYCMSNGGEMQTGWTKVGGKWYYMNSSGVMQTGWVRISGKWYYMNRDGVWTATR